MYNKIGDTKSLSQRIEEEIEGAIRIKKLKAGEKLPTEIELSKSYGVSRNALREALRSLNSKGLIRIEKGRGMFVNEFSLNQAVSSVNLLILLLIFGLVETSIKSTPSFLRFSMLYLPRSDNLSVEALTHSGL